MKFRFFIILALRFLGIGSLKKDSNARKSLMGAAVGIGISIVPLITVLVISDGMISGITQRTIELGSGHLQIIDMRPFANRDGIASEISLKEKLKEHNNTFVKNAWIERQGTALVVGKGGRSGGSIRAIEKKFFTENHAAHDLLNVIEGVPYFEDESSVILGKKIADDLSVHVGDTCRIVTLKKTRQGKAVPKMTPFKVSGIVSSGYQELDALWVFIPLEAGLKILSAGTSLTFINVLTADPFNETEMQKFLHGLKHLMPVSFSVFTWADLNRSLFYSFKTTKNLLMFIVFLIALTASANISSALVMLVMERRKEIAILKASGAHPFFIIAAFLFAGFLTGLGGIFLGFPIGLITAIHINRIFIFIENIFNKVQYLLYIASGGSGEFVSLHLLDPEYYLDHIPVVINFYELFFIVFILLILSVIVCIIPAIRAGKEKPIEIMRKL